MPHMHLVKFTDGRPDQLFYDPAGACALANQWLTTHFDPSVNSGSDHGLFPLYILGQIKVRETHC
jgi:hypothetical protein